MEDFTDVLYCNANEEDVPQFSISDVEKTLNETQITIRYWCVTYKLDADIKRKNGKDRCFSMNDIKHLQLIKKLRSEGMSGKDVFKVIEKLKNKKPINTNPAESNKNKSTTEEFFELMTTQMAAQLNDFSNSLLEQVAITVQERIDNTLKTHLNVHTEELKELGDNLSNQINNTVKSQIEEFKGYVDKKEMEFKEKDNKMIEDFRKQMENNKIIQEEVQKELEKERNKGFFKRLFWK